MAKEKKCKAGSFQTKLPLLSIHIENRCNYACNLQFAQRIPYMI